MTARTATGQTDIPTAGTRVQLYATDNVSRIKRVYFHAPAANTGDVFVGDSAVSVTAGFHLAPGEFQDFDYEDQSELRSYWYADGATNGNDIDWVMILAGGKT